MPSLGKSSYGLHSRFTGSILLLGLASWPGVAQGAAPNPEMVSPPEGPVAAPEIEIIEAEVTLEPARSQQEPEGRVSLPRFSVTPTHSTGGRETPVFTVAEAPPPVLALAPEAAAQGTPAFTPAEANGPLGIQVPWYVAQGLPPSSTPIPPMPSAEAGAYYPAIPAVGGMWVWIPYGTPLNGTSALPAGATAPWAQSVAVPPSVSPYGGAPGYWPGGMPQGYPAPTAAIPWGGPYGVAPSPYGVAPSPYGVAPSPYGVAPSPYGVAPSPYGAVPQLSPYGQVNSAAAPLSVPALPPGVASSATVSPPPQAPAAWGQASLPPVVPGTYLPSGNPSEPWPLTGQNPSLNPAPWAQEVVTAPPLPEPNLDIQGLYVLQGDSSSARARLSGDAFLTPNLLVGGTLDVVTGPDLTTRDGLNLTELYLATAVTGVPGLRFRLGQLDLTSYFDRNSFAKDISRDFFNSTFHTNPALIAGANATASRLGGLMQWAITDNIALNASVFSSSPDITDFALNGFAGELAFRAGDFILRGTFDTAQDTAFQGTGGRLEAYGLNAEWFIPQLNVGLFGRYGNLYNNGSGLSENAYSFGFNVLDLFMENDRLGLGYGRNLTTTVPSGQSPDVLELFYDFEVIPNIRLGFTFQQRDQFQESYAGFRIRGDLNLLPGRTLE